MDSRYLMDVETFLGSDKGRLFASKEIWQRVFDRGFEKGIN